MFGRKVVQPPQPQTPASPVQNFDPIAAAAKYVGCVSGRGAPIFVDGLGESNACFRGNEEAGVCFLFTSSLGGAGKVYFFQDFASVWVDGEPAPRAQIPTGMIANRIADYEAALIDLLHAGRGEAMLSALRRIAGS